jgi:hypothetical protein
LYKKYKMELYGMAYRWCVKRANGERNCF